jgi:hypothetical protein
MNQSSAEQSFSNAEAEQGPGYSSKEAYSFGCPAEEIYNHATKFRQAVIDRGRRMAAVTIPSVFPPDGYMPGDIIGEANQSVGAICVNTLASKLQFMAFPTDRPVLRFDPVEHKLRKDIDANPRLFTEVNIGLSRLELEHRRRLEGTQIRSAYTGSIKALLVGGNICWDHMYIDRPVYHLPDKYVVKRNSVGDPLHTVIKQETYLQDLDTDIVDHILDSQPELRKVKDYERKVDIYRVCRRRREEHFNTYADPNKAYYWEYWEEFKGEVIAGTEFEADYDNPPLWPAWMIPIYGHDWGRSYCEEYEGDLLLVEGHSASLNDGSALASLAWLFNKPGSRVSARVLKKSGNLTVHTGQADDITIGPQLEGKARDFQFVGQNLDRAIQRLNRAFLLMSSVQRDAERVTAEEFKTMARELEEATGGLYSELAQTFQRHVVRRFVNLHGEADKQLPQVPEGVFNIAVITGLEAQGRANEGDNLIMATQTHVELTNGASLQYVDLHDLVRRIYMSRSVNMDGLVRTPEEQQAFEAEKKQQMGQQTMLDKGTGPAINAAAKVMGSPEAMAAMMGKATGQGGPPAEPEQPGAIPPPQATEQ